MTDQGARTLCMNSLTEFQKDYKDIDYNYLHENLLLLSQYLEEKGMLIFYDRIKYGLKYASDVATTGSTGVNINFLELLPKNLELIATYFS